MQDARPRPKRPSIGKVVRLAIPVVRFELGIELHSRHRGAALEHRSCYPVHPVHDATIDTQDDRVRRVNLLDEAKCSTMLRTVGSEDPALNQ